ncbi:MAG: flagellar filament capping protein FliD [Lachnospiraceae bacterium]|jgi:hypothetical protein|nr:flagellar filament capping protein FliD [Lachnospiraceae bacterium]NBJ80794.1 hypothetical protein [bacterium 1XD42-76]NBK04003.1 hypothetical protein [bacterium 1XD42-94]
MGVNGISSGYSYNGYSAMLDSETWRKNAESAAEKLESSSSSKTESSSSTGSSSNVSSNSSTSTFLLGYQSALEDLEAAAAKLQVGNKDNLFSKYEAALREDAATKLPENEDGTKPVSKADKAADDIVAAVKDFAQKYNDVVSYLSNNTNRGSGISEQLAAFKRAIPTEQGLKVLGMKVDSKGMLQVDEDKLKEALEKDPEEVKNLLGGQFGIADRVGNKATSILDSPVNKIVGSTSDESGTKTNHTGSSDGASTTGSYLKSGSTMSDSFLQFAGFARSGAYNLTNYYAVSMLNMLV